VRESVAEEEGKVRDVLRDVQVLGVATELVILSTCNRVEVYGVADAPDLACAAAFRELARFRGVDAAAVEPCSTPTSTAMPCATLCGSQPASTQ
jgi:glutamyl-tRNA reductase